MSTLYNILSYSYEFSYRAWSKHNLRKYTHSNNLTPAQNGTLSGTPIFDFETFLKSSKINNSNSNFKTIFFNKLLSWCILKFSFMYHSNVKLIKIKK